MISLNITGENAEDFASQVHGFVSLLNGTAPVALVANGGTAQATDIGVGSETERKSRSRKTKDADPTPQTEPAQQDTTATGDTSPSKDGVDQGQETSSTSTTATNAASPSDEDATNIDKVKARAMAFAQKGGPAALVEMLVGAGAASGKFSEIVGNTTAIKLVSDALAAAGY